MVQADIENTGIAFEAVLRPVPMMDVPVQNNDLLQPVFLLQITGGDRNVVEQAEAKCDVSLGVMARRSDQSKAVICFTLDHGIGQGKHAAGGQQRDLE